MHLDRAVVHARAELERSFRSGAELDARGHVEVARRGEPRAREAPVGVAHEDARRLGAGERHRDPRHLDIGERAGAAAQLIGERTEARNRGAEPIGGRRTALLHLLQRDLERDPLETQAAEFETPEGEQEGVDARSHAADRDTAPAGQGIDPSVESLEMEPGELLGQAHPHAPEPDRGAHGLAEPLLGLGPQSLGGHPRGGEEPRQGGHREDAHAEREDQEGATQEAPREPSRR